MGHPPPELLRYWAQFGRDPDIVFVAHNAAFDSRVWQYKLQLDVPRVHCSLECMRAVIPNHRGGYGLANLARLMGTQKIEIDLENCTPEQEREYVINDVHVCRLIHKFLLRTLHPHELTVAELTARTREMYFIVDKAKAHEGFEKFIEMAQNDLSVALDILCGASSASESNARKRVEMLSNLVNFNENGSIRSVKVEPLRKAVLMQLGLDLPSTSYKKLQAHMPHVLRQSREVKAVVEHVSKGLALLLARGGVVPNSNLSKQAPSFGTGRRWRQFPMSADGDAPRPPFTPS